MTKTIVLNEDHLKLLPFLYLQEKGDNEVTIDKTHLFSLGSHLLEDIAFALGRINEAIPNTETNPNGRAFDDKFEEYMLQLYKYIADNLYYIETLIHQFSIRGGLTSGVYKCQDNELIWSKTE